MAQVKIYCLRSNIDAHRQTLSDIVHASAIAAFALPEDKRFHRFIALEAEDFIYPAGRTDAYTIVEMIMFEGRSVDSKKQFYAELYARTNAELDLHPNDLEIVLIETPRINWGIRGQAGDELTLSYTVET